ncbi:MAG: hypothetical protein H6599_02145 [Flavobacteriales bacterium]|nr:hypothetical protein [Flavobacteriales bacterium]
MIGLIDFVYLFVTTILSGIFFVPGCEFLFSNHDPTFFEVFGFLSPSLFFGIFLITQTPEKKSITVIVKILAASLIIWTLSFIIGFDTSGLAVPVLGGINPLILGLLIEQRPSLEHSRKPYFLAGGISSLIGLIFFFSPYEIRGNLTKFDDLVFVIILWQMAVGWVIIKHKTTNISIHSDL